ncbi:MAG: OmpA/MotB family protein [Rhodospirillales bacterium]
MPPPPGPQDDEEDESWMATYADAITLLMAFFVMLVSFSKVDIPLYEKVAAGIKNEIGKKDTQSPMSILNQSIKDIVYEQQADQVVQVAEDDQGVTIELASNAFYLPGSADIRPEALPVLDTIFRKINEEKYANYIVEIEGHTDDDPISTLRYPSNWELAAGRAATVARLFVGGGMDPFRLKAVSFAETRPKVPNRTPEGEPIKENQAQNRRVVLRVFPMDLDEMAERNKLRDMKAAQERAKLRAQGAEGGTEGSTPAQEGDQPPAETSPPPSSGQAPTDPTLENVPQFGGGQ